MPVANQNTAASKSKGATSPWATLDSFVQNADTKLHKLAGKTARAADESSLKIHLGLMELEDTWKKLQSKIERQVDTLRRLEKKALTASGEARLQAHLAKADIVSAAKVTRSRVRLVERRLHTLKVKSESEAADVLRRLSDACSDLAKRLG